MYRFLLLNLHNHALYFFHPSPVALFQHTPSRQMSQCNICFNILSPIRIQVCVSCLCNGQKETSVKMLHCFQYSQFMPQVPSKVKVMTLQGKAEFSQIIIYSSMAWCEHLHLYLNTSIKKVVFCFRYTFFSLLSTVSGGMNQRSLSVSAAKDLSSNRKQPG